MVYQGYFGINKIPMIFCTHSSITQNTSIKDHGIITVSMRTPIHYLNREMYV